MRISAKADYAIRAAAELAAAAPGLVKGEQIAAPRDLYEHPANEFVMSFVGPVNRVGDGWVRPHDLELRLEPNGSTAEAMIERIVHLGFEVRVELLRHDGHRLWAQVTRDECEELELQEGQIVFVRPSRERRFSVDAV